MRRPSLATVYGSNLTSGLGSLCVVLCSFCCPSGTLCSPQSKNKVGELEMLQMLM